MTTKEIVLTFESGLTTVEELLKKLLLEEVSKLAGKNGLLKNNRNAKDTVKNISDILKKVVNESDYIVLVDELIDNFDDITQNVVSDHKRVNNISVNPAIFTPEKDLFVQQITSSLIEGGIVAEFEKPMQEVIFSYIRNNAPLTELEDAIRNSVSVSVKRWAGTTARDAVFGYQGAANEAIKNEYDMDGWVYLGSIRLNTRSQCQYWLTVGKQKDEFWNKQIKRAKKGFTYNKKRTTGFKKGTNQGNFAVNRGGWGCLHELLPVFVD